jgi:hypothetical protein
MRPGRLGRSVVRLVMTEAERAELADIGDTSNDGIKVGRNAK